MAANRDAAGEKWTLPVSILVGTYYNALRPQGGATWQLRAQIAVVF